MNGKERKKMIAVIVFFGVICILLVMLSAYAAELKHQNNTIENSNDVLTGEIESLNVEIKTASSVEHIEKVAVKKLGMVYPDSENTVLVTKKDRPKGNFAAIIRSEAYN